MVEVNINRENENFIVVEKTFIFEVENNIVLLEKNIFSKGLDYKNFLFKKDISEKEKVLIFFSVLGKNFLLRKKHINVNFTENSKGVNSINITKLLEIFKIDNREIVWVVQVNLKEIVFFREN